MFCTIPIYIYTALFIPKKHKLLYKFKLTYELYTQGSHPPQCICSHYCCEMFQLFNKSQKHYTTFLTEREEYCMVSNRNTIGNIVRLDKLPEHDLASLLLKKCCRNFLISKRVQAHNFVSHVKECTPSSPNSTIILQYYARFLVE